MSSVEERLAALETKVRLLEDQHEIRQLVCSYGPAVDIADNLEKSRKLASLWSEDGIYDVDPFGRPQGREEIAHFFEGLHFEMVPQGCAHIMSAPYIRITGDTAVALAYSCVFRPDGEQFLVWRVASNEWNLVRKDGRWQVAERINRLMRGSEQARGLFNSIHDLIAKADTL